MIVYHYPSYDFDIIIDYDQQNNFDIIKYFNAIVIVNERDARTPDDGAGHHKPSMREEL
jgi:hypothetical protein